ncbi:MAG TPA: ATP-dependent protease subunit HslV [Candidatus Polarisedimenticolia bacterium]|jgi:ATP-dependent HslUV protease subunit HslV|nr:ATP-dependent protease subunit HslV [Candidatus Polarisedimenticolia bacterium]
MPQRFRHTTILCVRHQGSVAMAGDGQVTLGHSVVKHGARKIRKVHNGSILAGFAGSAADAIALFTKFEAKLEEFRGNLERASVELVKDWRTDKMLRRLEAHLVVANGAHGYLLSGTGDLIEPDDGLLALGSGGPLALAAARALIAHSGLDARSVALEAMKIAAGIDIYTNDNLSVEVL